MQITNNFAHVGTTYLFEPTFKPCSSYLIELFALNTFFYVSSCVRNKKWFQGAYCTGESRF